MPKWSNKTTALYKQIVHWQQMVSQSLIQSWCNHLNRTTQPDLRIGTTAKAAKTEYNIKYEYFLHDLINSSITSRWIIQLDIVGLLGHGEQVIFWSNKLEVLVFHVWNSMNWIRIKGLRYKILVRWVRSGGREIEIDVSVIK